MEMKGKVNIFGKHADSEKIIYIGDDDLTEIMEGLEGKEVVITIKEAVIENEDDKKD